MSIGQRLGLTRIRVTIMPTYSTGTRKVCFIHLGMLNGQTPGWALSLGAHLPGVQSLVWETCSQSPAVPRVYNLHATQCPLVSWDTWLHTLSSLGVGPISDSALYPHHLAFLARTRAQETSVEYHCPSLHPEAAGNISLFIARLRSRTHNHFR